MVCFVCFLISWLLCQFLGFREIQLMICRSLEYVQELRLWLVMVFLLRNFKKKKNSLCDIWESSADFRNGKHTDFCRSVKMSNRIISPDCIFMLILKIIVFSLSDQTCLCNQAQVPGFGEGRNRSQVFRFTLSKLFSSPFLHEDNFENPY